MKKIFIVLLLVLFLTFSGVSFVKGQSTDVLLFRDILPWGSNADSTVLTNLGYAFETHIINDVSTLNLSNYKVIIIASDQPQSFYDGYASNYSKFQNYVKSGGVLVFFACDQGWGGGALSAPLPGGVTKENKYEEYNYIVDSNHPIVTGELTDNQVLTNADLVGSYCSHSVFDNLDTQVANGAISNLDIVFKGSNSNKPTLAVYKVGNGVVIASGNTWEIGYDWSWAFSRKALDDVFAYAYKLAVRYIIRASASFGGTITPSGDISVSKGSNQPFTIKANSGYFIYRILVDGNPILFNNSLEYTYTFTNVTANHTIEAQFMKQLDLAPPSLTLPTINGVNLDMPNSLLQINTSTLTFTVQASDESGIARMVVKVNGVTQIDKNNLDPTITLNEGMNTVEVTVYDTYGNYTTKSFKVLKDTEGPTIILRSDLPQTVSSNTFTLKGTVIDSASGISTLMVNNHSIAVTLDGNFELQLTLTQGTNTITIEAVDKLGNKTTKTVTLSYNTSQSKSYIITLKVGDPHIAINGIEKNIDAQGSKPIIKNSRTLVPIRVIIESLGGTVEWDNTQKKVTITLGYNTIELWIGNPIAKVNGVDTPIDSTNSKVVPEIINGRTYLPLRFISENLGASVDWDSKTQTITIYYFQ